MRPLNDGQSVFPAQPVGDFHHSLSLGLGIIVLAAVPKGHGVEAKVAVQMFFIQMSGDDDLKAVAPHFLCQLHANLVGKLRRDLLRLEALIAVPSDVAVGFSVALFS